LLMRMGIATTRECADVCVPGPHMEMWKRWHRHAALQASLSLTRCNAPDVCWGKNHYNIPTLKVR
jgi:hypothetical protein